ncbi:alpha/beta fold hydrolase [Labrys miyagiensis]|uniref:alpha/beta fold hydrolase n=1 Tax=Labrys miyagiensis TaxID=346912 RepID=UPI0024E179B6|nr:alpha/beta fold hydrolase [Labrys miyagiensis]
MRTVETRYARNGGTRIAYRVVGQGSLDLVLVSGFPSNLDILDENPGYARLVKRLSVFGRLILFDMRGTGLSDRNGLERRGFGARAEDIRTVIDAAGCGRAILIGASEGAALSVLFAANNPERVRALVLFGGYTHSQDTVMDSKRLRTFIESIEASWGNGSMLHVLVPGRADDRHFANWWARFERLSASPTDAAALIRMNAEIDIRDRLSDVRTPALIIHRIEDLYAGVDGSRRLARGITGARLAELPGRDHPIWTGDVDRVADLIEEFLTGQRPVADGNRVLAVLLIVRVANKSGRSATCMEERLLDERLERLREAVPAVTERHGGRAEWSSAERIVVRFDGPTRAVAGAIALREIATSLGFPIAQAIHIGEIDIALQPLSGSMLDIADCIAAAARPTEILLSRQASDLVSGSGLQFVDRGILAVENGRDGVPIVVLVTERHLEPVLRMARPIDAKVLSAREREVLSLIADGESNVGIALHLGLSEHTVKRHVANILLKLDLPTRAAAAALVGRQPGL